MEELLHPENAPPALEDEDIIRRYHIGENDMLSPDPCRTYWLYRMINTRRPLEEKLALFWHGVFATGNTKLNHARVILKQIYMFRHLGMGSLRTLLIELSKNPAMIYWLDNKNNHKDAVNENFGRELLELFSMGVGNYTEDDVRECSRAFTGWTIYNEAMMTARAESDLAAPYGRTDWQFHYRDEDHDDSEKTFLGQQGAFNGEDIIDIICRQPATARFIARHLYNFFVADEPQVSAWETVPPRDPDAINTLSDAYITYEYDIRSMLRVLFNSNFFKNAAFAKVKSPTELVVGTVRLVGGHRFPDVEDLNLANKPGFMGQTLLDPPSVEGWHTGIEWINTGSLVDRVNFAVDQFSKGDNPGVRSMIDRIEAQWDGVSPGHLVDTCLDLIGPLTVSERTRQELVAHAAPGGEIRPGKEADHRSSADRIGDVLKLIVATREYQLA